MAVRTTRFTDAAAVEAWDAWFRWRDRDRLHDRTIDDTWWRVARAIVPDTADGLRDAHRYVDAFSRWQLLPDERLLHLAGTGHAIDHLESPCAVLNVGAFVIAPRTREARFDRERFASVAALAVSMLDDANIMQQRIQTQAAALRIGIIGFADALRRLGIRYDGIRAIEQANLVGELLASATMRGSIELARERGALDAAPECLMRRWRNRGVPDDLLDATTRTGVRHSQLTAIDVQPRLALLANNASDAIDPHSSVRNSTSARPALEPAGSHDGISGIGIAAARTAIRAAMQPHIDAPIDFPVAAAC